MNEVLAQALAADRKIAQASSESGFGVSIDAIISDYMGAFEDPSLDEDEE